MRLDLAPLVDPPHPASLDAEQLTRRIQLGHSRSAGPGGQHRNKVATRVQLLDVPTGITAAAGERRSVRENKPVAIRRLRLALAIGCRTAVPLGPIGSQLWQSRRQGSKIVINDHHWDYPALLAEALDVIVAMNGDVRKAAIRLDTSSSQLIRLLSKHAPAMVALNEFRIARGDSPLRDR